MERENLKLVFEGGMFTMSFVSFGYWIYDQYNNRCKRAINIESDLEAQLGNPPPLPTTAPPTTAASPTTPQIFCTGYIHQSECKNKHKDHHKGEKGKDYKNHKHIDHHKDKSQDFKDHSQGASDINYAKEIPHAFSLAGCSSSNYENIEIMI